MANFLYNFSVTGDCTNTNSGAIEIFVSGGIPPYTIDWVNPNIGTGSFKDNLSAGVYIVRVNDSLGDINNEFYINMIVSSGGCLNVVSTSGTTCGLDNGQVVITGTSEAYPITLKIFSGNTEILSGITYNGELTFTNLPSGVLRAYYEDYGGCSGFSESFIIQPSSVLDWGFYVVNDTLCNGNVGKLQITGLTGTPPYTYLWSNGSTGTTITGLTASTYSVTVTDSTGCSSTKSAEIKKTDPLELVSFQTVSPSCFAADGSVNLIVTGGTGPYFYSGTNGTNGASGISGYSGYSGFSGAVGASGTSGYSGYSGNATSMVYDQFTATASQTTFTTSVSYISGKITVFCNGVEMVNGTDVTVTSGSSVVFATGLASGTRVDLVYPRT